MVSENRLSYWGKFKKNRGDLEAASGSQAASVLSAKPVSL